MTKLIMLFTKTVTIIASNYTFRSLVYPGPFYPEGPTHVIPLMIATLPGIDPNDMRKSMTTFQFISTFATLVPIVDTSGAHEFYKGLLYLVGYAQSLFATNF